MHEIGQRDGARYGFLEMNGKALTDAQISRLVGIEVTNVVELLEELKEAGVCSEEEGVIYSRRFARDGLLKQKRTEAGSKGGSKTQANSKQKLKQKLKQKGDQNTSKGARARGRAEVEEEEEEEENIKTKKEQAQEVIELYHLLCPSLPPCKTLTDKRISHINARLSEGVDFKDLFIKAEASDFLAGRSENFRAEISFLINPENCAKTLEGKYDNRDNPRTEKDRDYSDPFG